MYCYCLSYTYHAYNNLNKQPEGTVIVNTDHTSNDLNKQPEDTVIVYTDHTCNNLNKQPKGNANVLVIPTTPAMI
jgi:hypothetical protein